MYRIHNKESIKKIIALLFFISESIIRPSALIVDAVPIVHSVMLPSPEATENVRFITVYVPAEALQNPLKRFPCVYCLPGLGGTHTSFTVANQLLMDDLINEGQVQPFILVHVDPSLVNGVDTDGKRRYQGTWYVNSALNGNFEDFMVLDLIPYVDAHYPTLASASSRGIMGQSMGGYGAQYHGIMHPELYCAFAHASGTPFFLLTTNSTLVAPTQPSPGFEMFTFNSFILPEIPTTGPNAGKIAPTNGQLTFSIFSYAAAFSPNVDNPPYYVDLPFEVDEQGVPVFQEGAFIIHNIFNGTPLVVNKSLIPRPDVISRWTQFDPYLLLNDRIETTKKQGIYHDGGSLEPLNAAGARLFSDKMGVLGIDNEYILFNGNHTDCLTSELCARYRTIFQLMSALFARNGVYTNDTRIKLVGKGGIILKDTAYLTIENVIVGIETSPALGVTETDISLVLNDAASFSIGAPDGKKPGVLQIGNALSKAVLRGDPSLADHKVSCALTIDGEHARFSLEDNSILGIGAGVNGNGVSTLNECAISSLLGVDTCAVHLKKGEWVAQKVASGAEQSSAVLLIGTDAFYSVKVNNTDATLRGGCNVVQTVDCLERHPVALIQAGLNTPKGVRNNLNTNPAAIDYFTHASVASSVYYTNNIEVGTLTSSAQLDNKYNPSGNSYELITASAQDLFDFLAINTQDDYQNSEYTAKEGAMGLVNGTPVLTYIDQGTIVRVPAANIPLDAGQQIDFALIAQRNGTVKIWIEEVNGARQLIRVDPF